MAQLRLTIYPSSTIQRSRLFITATSLRSRLSQTLHAVEKSTTTVVGLGLVEARVRAVAGEGGLFRAAVGSDPSGVWSRIFGCRDLGAFLLPCVLIFFFLDSRGLFGDTRCAGAGGSRAVVRSLRGHHASTRSPVDSTDTLSKTLLSLQASPVHTRLLIVTLDGRARCRSTIQECAGSETQTWITMNGFDARFGVEVYGFGRSTNAVGRRSSRSVIVPALRRSAME